MYRSSGIGEFLAPLLVAALLIITFGIPAMYVESLWSSLRQGQYGWALFWSIAGAGYIRLLILIAQRRDPPHKRRKSKSRPTPLLDKILRN